MGYSKGFSFAAHAVGWETVGWCEWNEFGQRVLKHHFPKAKAHGDITKTDFSIYANRIDVLTGGFPCQPFSVAGSRSGTEDARYLWPKMLETIKVVKPTWVVGENVTGILSMEDNKQQVFFKVESRNIVRTHDFDKYEAIYTRQASMLVERICKDLEEAGYEVQPIVIPAGAVGAPHRRDRIWFIAYSDNDGLPAFENRQSVGKRDDGGEAGENKAGESERCAFSSFTSPSNAHGKRFQRGTAKYRIWEEESIQQAEILRSRRQWEYFPTQPAVCSGDDGLSSRLDGITFSKWRTESVKAAGNAIVPQVAIEIFKAIQNLKK